MTPAPKASQPVVNPSTTASPLTDNLVLNEVWRQAMDRHDEHMTNGRTRQAEAAIEVASILANTIEAIAKAEAAIKERAAEFEQGVEILKAALTPSPAVPPTAIGGDDAGHLPPIAFLRPPKVHELKTWPAYYRQVVGGFKTFEIRKNDRDYAVNDTLKLLEWDPQTEAYSGYYTEVQVSHLLAGGRFGLDPDYVVMSIVKPGTSPAPSPIESAGGLKACPFCGSRRIETFPIRDGREVMCKGCAAKSGPAFNGPADKPSASDRAIEAWNTRTPAPLPPASRGEIPERGIKMSDVKTGMILRPVGGGLPRQITVTEITDKGFLYEHEPLNIHPFMGTMTGGEHYGIEGYALYELAAPSADNGKG